MKTSEICPSWEEVSHTGWYGREWNGAMKITYILHRGAYVMIPTVFLKFLKRGKK
jgi:hypothetical protein